MKKKWKKLVAISCALTMIMTTPGMSVLADEMSAEEIIESVAEEPDAIEETWEMAESLDEEIEISEADSVDQEVQETGSWSDDHLVGAASTIISGSCGTSATWDLKDNGDLYIGGTGDMTNYENADKVPWKAYRSSINKVIIGNGITSIGRYAFYGCSSLSDISFTATSKVKSIGGDAFTNRLEKFEVRAQRNGA